MEAPWRGEDDQLMAPSATRTGAEREHQRAVQRRNDNYGRAFRVGVAEQPWTVAGWLAAGCSRYEVRHGRLPLGDDIDAAYDAGREEARLRRRDEAEWSAERAQLAAERAARRAQVELDGQRRRRAAARWRMARRVAPVTTRRTRRLIRWVRVVLDGETVTG